MAEKGFGVKEVNLIGASGTPTITSPNNLNLNAVNVAISTNVSVGGTLTVSGNVSVGGTLTYEDVTNIDSVGVVTARNGVVVVGRGVSIAAGGLNVTAGISTLSGIVKIMSGLDIQTNGTLDIIGSSSSSGLDIQSNASVQIGQNGFPNRDYATFTDTGVNLNYSGSTKLATSNTGVTVTGTVAATAFSGSGASLTGIAVTEAPVVDYTITGSNPNYYFHGGGVDETDGNPDLYLIRGQKYRFNNTTGSGHPFRFTHTGNANAAYSNGVTGTESGVQFWTIPYDAPAKLFYVCTIHSGMVGNIYIRGANGQNTNVGITTFTGLIDVTQIKKSSGTLDFLAATHTFNNAAGSTEYFRITSSGTAVFGGNTAAPIVDNGEMYYRGNSTSTFQNLPQNFYLYSDDKAYNATNPGAGLLFGGIYTSTGQYTTFAGIHGIKENNTDNNYSSALVFGTRQQGSNTWERLRITSDGEILTPQQVGIAVRLSSNQSHPGNNSFENSNSIMNFDTEVWDIGSNFNTSTKTFTAPVAGRYLCCYTIQIEGISNWLWLYIYPVVNGSNTQTQAKGVVYADMAGNGVSGNSTTTAEYQMFSNTVIMNLAANDAVTLRTRGQISGTIKSGAETQWTMQLLG